MGCRRRWSEDGSFSASTGKGVLNVVSVELQQEDDAERREKKKRGKNKKKRGKTTLGACSVLTSGLWGLIKIEEWTLVLNEPGPGLVLSGWAAWAFFFYSFFMSGRIGVKVPSPV